MNKPTPSFACLSKEFPLLFVVRKVKEADGFLTSQLLQFCSRDLHFCLCLLRRERKIRSCILPRTLRMFRTYDRIPTRSYRKRYGNVYIT